MAEFAYPKSAKAIIAKQFSQTTNAAMTKRLYKRYTAKQMQSIISYNANISKRLSQTANIGSGTRIAKNMTISKISKPSSLAYKALGLSKSILNNAPAAIGVGFAAKGLASMAAKDLAGLSRSKSDAIGDVVGITTGGAQLVFGKSISNSFFRFGSKIVAGIFGKSAVSTVAASTLTRIGLGITSAAVAIPASTLVNAVLDSKKRSDRALRIERNEGKAAADAFEKQWFERRKTRAMGGTYQRIFTEMRLHDPKAHAEFMEIKDVAKRKAFMEKRRKGLGREIVAVREGADFVMNLITLGAVRRDLDRDTDELNRKLNSPPTVLDGIENLVKEGIKDLFGAQSIKVNSPQQSPIEGSLLSGVSDGFDRPTNKQPIFSKQESDFSINAIFSPGLQRTKETDDIPMDIISRISEISTMSRPPKADIASKQFQSMDSKKISRKKPPLREEKIKDKKSRKVSHVKIDGSVTKVSKNQSARWQAQRAIKNKT